MKLVKRKRPSVLLYIDLYESLAYACKRGDIATVEFLIEEVGLNPNGWEPDYEETTGAPLAISLIYGRLHIAEYLLQKGAHPRIIEDFGRVVYEAIVFTKKYDAIKFMLQNDNFDRKIIDEYIDRLEVREKIEK